MLVIRNEQMDVLSEYMVEQFVNDALLHLRTTFPEQIKDMPVADLRSMIYTGIKNAGEYNITMEEDVLRYLELMITYGADFDMNPDTSWAEEILNKEDARGTEKIQLMDKYIASNLKG
jgi:hypothetical protein